MLYNQKIYRSSSDNLIGSLPYKQQGLAARATYSWNDRYFFEANLGYNGSENFSPENVSVSSLHLVLAGLSLMRLGGNLCKKLFLTLKCVIQMA